MMRELDEILYSIIRFILGESEVVYIVILPAKLSEKIDFNLKYSFYSVSH
ncbi:MAG: hypothetical protein BWY45_03165 [Euryarchaeota archaeon ADurb.Bin294]|nr:MAG: hypothetical protein BWY45_03165 [Euryarchaeota archaeon ADurb.Bin294]